jgi:hypothetical protein
MTEMPDEFRPHQDLSLDDVGLDRTHLKPDYGVKDNLFLEDAAEPMNECGIECRDWWLGGGCHQSMVSREEASVASAGSLFNNSVHQ